MMPCYVNAHPFKLRLFINKFIRQNQFPSLKNGLEVLLLDEPRVDRLPFLTGVFEADL